MGKSYQIPKKGSAKLLRDCFWNRVVDDQARSGMSGKKFCQQHQLPFSTFKNKKYGKQPMQKNDVSGEVSTKGNPEGFGFIPVHIADGVEERQSKFSQGVEDFMVKIYFRNGHAVEFSLLPKEDLLHVLIKQVAELKC